jgi:hypothetical protein
MTHFLIFIVVLAAILLQFLYASIVQFDGKALIGYLLLFTIQMISHTCFLVAFKLIESTV